MKRDTFWTVAAVTVLSIVAILILWAPTPNLQATSGREDWSPNGGENRPGRSSDPDTASSPRAGSPGKPAPRPPIHWAEAPYATDDDVFAIVFQPRKFAMDEDYAALEPLLGPTLPRDVAKRTEWVAAYGRAVESELDIARNLTLVIRQAEPTTAVDLASDRYSGRTLTDEVLGDVPYLRVAETTETVLMERADKDGTYRERENTVEHEALAIVEHDPQTYLVVPESRLSQSLETRMSPPSLAAELRVLSRETHCAFVCRESKGRLLGTLARTAGDRSAALAAPLLAMLQEATHVSVTAGLGEDHLARITLTLSTAGQSTETLRRLTGLQSETRALLANADLAGGEILRLLLESLRLEAHDSRVVVTLPRPADLKALFGGDRVSSR